MVVETITTEIPVTGVVGLNYLEEPPRSLIRNELVFKENSFVVSNPDGTYAYLFAKYASSPNGNFFNIQMMPPVLKDGFACIEGEIYAVSINELVRGKINVAKRISKESNVEHSNTSPAIDGTDELIVAAIASDLKPEASGSDGFKVTKDVDLAFQNQIDALLDFENLKEGRF